MKNSKTCPKCHKNEIAVIQGGGFQGNIYNTLSFGLTTIYLSRYVCVHCGYTENYVDNVTDLQKIREKYFNQNPNNELTS